MEQGRRPVRARDAWLPAAIFVVGLAELWSLRTDGWLAAIALEGVAAAGLVRRARWPVSNLLAIAAVMTIPWVGPALDDAATPLLVIIVAIFSLGRHAGRWEGPLLVAVAVGLVAVDYALVDTRQHDWTDVIFVLAMAAPPFVFGRVVQQLDRQGRLLRTQQEQIRTQAVRAERDRIARELHDVVAHSVSAMVVQAAAAQDQVRRDPDRAEALLAVVADTGRAALAETGRLLHLVRDEDDELGLAPAPGLADVPALVEEFRAAGMVVEATLDLPPGPAPAGLDVSAYRVVQEALTNARRHGAGRVRLEISAVAQALRISSSNAVGESRGHAADHGAGLGLQGMAERVALLGGGLSHDTTGGRFSLDVTIPWERA